MSYMHALATKVKGVENYLGNLRSMHSRPSLKCQRHCEGRLGLVSQEPADAQRAIRQTFVGCMAVWYGSVWAIIF